MENNGACKLLYIIISFNISYNFTIDQLLFHAMLTNNQFALISILINPNSNAPYNINVKTESNCLISHILHSMNFLLSNADS